MKISFRKIALFIALLGIGVAALSIISPQNAGAAPAIPEICTNVDENGNNGDSCIRDALKMAGGDSAPFMSAVDACATKRSPSGQYEEFFGTIYRPDCAKNIAYCTKYIGDRNACFDGGKIADRIDSRPGVDSSKTGYWNGYGATKNEDIRANRHNAFKTDVVDKLVAEKCKQTDPIDLGNCQRELRAKLNDAFNGCYDQLGKIDGSNNANDLAVDDKQLADCIEAREPITKGLVKESLPENGGATPTNSGDETSSCRVESVGWLVCPVTKFLAGIADSAYDLVLKKLLVVEKLNVDTSNGGDDMYKAWEIMRNIANVAFVVAFLIIIYSQITGVGIGNYGIKRMLPRLIIAAILVNVSYWICAAAVDVSNILGATLKDAASGLGADQAKILEFTIDETGKDGGKLQATGNGWAAFTVVLLGVGGALLYLGLSILLPALIVVIMAVITVVLVLTLRQALIILLIIISPLAFVAYLLPNTESLFKKWMGLFKTLLLMYPIISLIFGASALASTLVMKSAQGSMLISLMGACIAVIPLFITPVIMKSAGGLLNRFGGVINNPNKGPFDRMRKGADNIRKRQEGRREIRALTGGRVVGGGRFRRKALRNAVDAGIETERSRASQEFVADQVQNNDKFRNKVAGGVGLPSMGATEAAMQRSLAGATLAVDKATVEAVNAEKVLLKNSSQEALQAMSQGLADSNGKMPTQEQRIAAMQMTVDSADFKGINKLIDANSGPGATKELQRALADALKNSSSRPGYVGQKAISEIRDGTAGKSEELMTKAINGGAYSAEAIATGDKDELSLVGNHAIHSTDGTLTLAGRQNFINNASTALTDPELSRKLGKNKATVEHIRTLDSSNEIRNHVNSSLV